MEYAILYCLSVFLTACLASLTELCLERETGRSEFVVFAVWSLIPVLNLILSGVSAAVLAHIYISYRKAKP